MSARFDKILTIRYFYFTYIEYLLVIKYFKISDKILSKIIR